MPTLFLSWSRLRICIVGGAILGAALVVHAATVRLDELNLTAMSAGWGKPQTNLSITKKPLVIGGVKFEHGVGTHAESYVSIQLDGKASWFTAKVGVDGGVSMAAPHIFSGDMAKLDAFTLNVLCNAEVIEVDQDPLGRQAKILRQSRDEFVLVKELADGSKAIGLFNLASHPQKLSVNWSELGVSGKQPVRDLWRQKEIGSFADKFEIEVPRHGVSMVRVSLKK